MTNVTTSVQTREVCLHVRRITVCAIQYTSVMRKGKYNIRSYNIEYSGSCALKYFVASFCCFMCIQTGVPYHLPNHVKPPTLVSV